MARDSRRIWALSFVCSYGDILPLCFGIALWCWKLVLHLTNRSSTGAPPIWSTVADLYCTSLCFLAFEIGTLPVADPEILESLDKNNTHIVNI